MQFLILILIHGASINASPVGHPSTNARWCQIIALTSRIVELCLELPYHRYPGAREDLPVHLGHHPSKYSMPKDAKGEQLEWNMGMKSTAVVPLFICALLVPEYMLATAVRQYLRAWEIAK